jgi:hypothetical protein
MMTRQCCQPPWMTPTGNGDGRLDPTAEGLRTDLAEWLHRGFINRR